MSLDLLHLLRFVALLAGGLLLPGWLLGRALGTPGGPAGALLGSAALLTNLLLLLDAIGVRLDAPRLSLALALFCAGLVLIARLRPRPNLQAAPRPERARWRWQSFYWLLLPASAGLLAIVVRTLIEPLSGWDCPFRWDFLAREMIRTGNLGFYPPFTADDFLHYGWCDGIAPLVSSLYAWSYLSLGRMETWATTPVVGAQGLLIFYVVGRLAAARSGPAAGFAAAALLATSAALLWAVAMGQETGLTALSVVTMFWFIERGRTDPRTGWMIWAGVAAGSGALAREYGLCFPALGLLALVWWRRPVRQALAFLAAAAAVSLPWYLRNWIKTGHPLYCFELGTLFPVNPVHAEYMHLVAKAFNLAANPDVFAPLPATVALLAGLPLVLGCAAGLARWRESGPWLGALLALFVLWLWLAGLTSGGVVYSTRSLAPAIALGAALGGGWLARAAALRHGWLVTLALGVLAVQAGATSLYLPLTVRPAWWREPPLAWHLFGELRRQWSEDARWQAIVDAAEDRKILVSDPIVHALLVDHGAHAVPLFSPDVRFLFRPDTGFQAGVTRLRAAGYRFVLITRENRFIDTQLAAYPFFPGLAATPPVLSARLYFLYDLYPAGQRRAAPPVYVH